jgi:hypothetical protein
MAGADDLVDVGMGVAGRKRKADEIRNTPEAQAQIAQRKAEQVKAERRIPPQFPDFQPVTSKDPVSTSLGNVGDYFNHLGDLGLHHGQKAMDKATQFKQRYVDPVTTAAGEAKQTAEVLHDQYGYGPRKARGETAPRSQATRAANKPAAPPKATPTPNRNRKMDKAPAEPAKAPAAAAKPRSRAAVRKARSQGQRPGQGTPTFTTANPTKGRGRTRAKNQ